MNALNAHAGNARKSAFGALRAGQRDPDLEELQFQLAKSGWAALSPGGLMVWLGPAGKGLDYAALGVFCLAVKQRKTTAEPSRDDVGPWKLHIWLMFFVFSPEGRSLGE